MCAITGILKRDGGPADRDTIARMTGQLGHRGPDGDGIAMRGPVAFGHRRLSIIDLEGGQQPMFNEDGNVWVTFNGEIYNYRELAEQLTGIGHRFRTRSDTEVIVHAWEQWGEQCVERLRGMFAFAVMDWPAGRLFLARDHMGIKPLHYLETPEYFAFASEPQALRFVPGFNGRLSYDAIDQFLWLQYIPAPKSIYAQARKLPPAHCLTVNLSGHVPPPREYWRFAFAPDESRTVDDWTEAVDAAIGESVRAHLVSDVPFGAFLSGGVDSSLVVARMSEALGQPVRAFSIGFEEAEFDETQFAAAAAKKCDADHTVEIVGSDALGILPKLAQHYGEPFGDSSAVPTYHVSELARRHVPMVLSGDGADELFAGYWSHGHFLNFCQSHPHAVPGLGDWLRFIQYTDVATRQALWRPEWRGHSPARLDTFAREWERAADFSLANKAQYLDLKTYLPFDILTKVDVASMAHGLEVRTPFVDVRVAELAAQIPDRFHLQPGANGKWEHKCLLRRVAAKYFGEEFVNRPKMGFAMPFARWVAPGGKLHDAVTQKLLGADSTVLPYFSSDIIQQLLNRGAFGPLWLCLFLEEWLRYHASAPCWTEKSDSLELQGAAAREIELDKPPVAAEGNRSAKPKIHLIADVPDWIFARHCSVISSALADEFDFDMGLQGHPYNEDDYDLIYPLEWNLVTPDQIRNPAKYITGIRSHTSWKDHDFKFFAKYLSEHFGIVHVVSERLREIFAPVMPDVRRLTHGVDTRFFKANKPVNSTDKQLRIGWAGNRINPTKGFEQLIKPLGDLPDVELVYCGYMDRKLDLPEMHGFYESIDAYICSSELEGNNNSLMEAAAMERAIITTDNGAVPEYLADGESALIIERRQEAFVRAVEQLRDNPDLRARLGRAARESVVARFEWRQMLEQHRALFREALGQPAAKDPLAQAEANVRQALELDPENQEARKLLLQIHVHRENWTEAAHTGEAILQNSPDDIETILVMAKSFFKAGDIEATRVSLEHVLELDPGNELAKQNLADLASTESAIAPEIEEAIGKGLAAIQQERLHDALKHYQRALELGLENAEIEQLVRQLETALNPMETRPGWSFCVITNGKKPDKLTATLESIRAVGFAAKEILVGGEPPAGLGDDVTVVPVVDGARNGRLGEMRNRLTERAQYDHLVVCDDDMLFHDDFAAGIEKYGDDWEVLCVRLLNPDGTRFWDWATHGGPKGHRLLDYGETDSHVYVTGGLCLMKAAVARRVKWDDGRGFYQGEDLDFSGRLHQAGVSIKFNRHCTVTHDDARYTRSGKVIVRREEEPLAPGEPKLPIRWLGPIFNPSGYASEAIDFLLPLADRLEIGLRHQSTLYSEKFVAGLSDEVREKLFTLRDRFSSLRGGISIAHNPANGFVRPEDADYCIGRTMFETDRISPEWVAACNRMDEVWAPSKFNVETFANSGVERDKLVVMPGAVDSSFFDPDRHEALPLPNKAAFNFLAIFEWSSRKAWDVLLASYLREFSAEDDVCLYLRTYQFGRPDGDPAAALWREIREFAATLDLGDKSWPRIELLTEQIAAPDLPKLYQAADCLVGISRGEGWGRPHHEAMSMALPVIATNWSGNTEFMTEDTACLIDCVLREARGLEPELWHYQGHHWADPSESQLREAMRRLQTRPDEARSLGQRARAHVVRNYSREAVAEKVVARLAKIEAKLNHPELCECPPRSETAGEVNRSENLTVSWEGSYLDFGSLSLVNRELTGQLARQPGIKLTRVGKNALPANADQGLREIARQLKPKARGNTQVTVRHNWPPDWSPAAGELRIHCQPWEYGVLPGEWVAQVENVDEIWAYTEYVRRVYVDSGVDPKKVKVVPLGIDPKRFSPDAQAMPLATRKSFKFLFVGGTIHRKGVDVLLQSYLDAFDIEDDVCLVIKDFGGGGVYQGQTMADQIKAAQSRPHAPEILYLDCEMSDADIPGLYTACDCLVHPYRGEGFGLPVLEAMACGLPAIVTGGGATDDFATDEHAWRLPAKRSRLGHEVGGLRLDGNGWLLEPCPEALKHALCAAAAHPAETKAKGEAACRHARSEWTWEKSAGIAAARIHEAWRTKKAAAAALAERRSRTGTVKLPAVARLGELSQAAELLLSKQHAEAWRETLAAMAVRPFHPEGWLTLARIAEDAGDLAMAKKCVATCRQIAPRYGRARKLAKSLGKAKGGKRVDWPELPKSGNRLSVIMITKNEEQFLDGCLKSVKEAADQLVVVDTGSADRTVEIARGHGAEVHHFDWIGDFSAARNEALSHARGDWVLFIDADEELTKEGAAELRRAMDQPDTIAWRLPIVDVGREHLGRSLVPRLFRNAPGLFFVGRIHEQVSSSVEARRAEWGLENRIGKATLLHRGYQEDVIRDRNKIARNIRLLEQAVEEFPNDANLLMNFGLELAKAGQINAALEQYDEAFAVFKLQPPEARTPELREALVTQFATHLLGQGRNGEAAAVLESPIARAVSLTASQEFLLGLAQLHLGQHRDAAKRFQACLKKRHEPALTPISPHIVKGGPDHCLALCLAKLSDARADQHFAAALEQDPSSVALHVDYARHLAAGGKPVEGIELLHQVIGETSEHLPAWQAGGDIALTRPELLEFARDWTVEARKFFPSDSMILRQHAEALLLSGQCAEALPLWEELFSRGGATAIGAAMICLVVTGRQVECPAEIEHPVSDAFVSWYRRLLECRNEATVEKINAAVPQFAGALPFAAKVLRTAFDDAMAA